MTELFKHVGPKEGSRPLQDDARTTGTALENFNNRDDKKEIRNLSLKNYKLGIVLL